MVLGWAPAPAGVRPVSATRVPRAAFLHLACPHPLSLHSLYVHSPYHHRVLERHSSFPAATVDISNIISYPYRVPLFLSVPVVVLPSSSGHTPVAPCYFFLAPVNGHTRQALWWVRGCPLLCFARARCLPLSLSSLRRGRCCGLLVIIVLFSVLCSSPHATFRALHVAVAGRSVACVVHTCVRRYCRDVSRLEPRYF